MEFIVPHATNLCMLLRCIQMKGGLMALLLSPVSLWVEHC